MGDEHDDDIEPEVDEGAEVETEQYPGTTPEDETAPSEEEESESPTEGADL
jgi:hypothetical protein